MPPTAVAAARDTQFNWEGKDRKGNKLRGKLLAVSEQDVRADLRRQNIVPTRIRKQTTLFSTGGKPSPMDIAIFSRQLATMLGAGIPLVEHLTGLGALPATGWRFFAVPPRIRGMATFPVRAFAIVG